MWRPHSYSHALEEKATHSDQLHQAVNTLMASPSSLVCAACSEAVFSYTSFQLALEDHDKEEDSPKGLTYTTQSWEEIVKGDDNDCNLCGILRDKITEYNGLGRNGKRGPPGPQETFQVTLRFRGSTLGVRIHYTNHEYQYPVYCDPGTY